MEVGWTELLLIGVVALIVIGPKDLPDMFRTMGRFTAKMRAMARDFSRAMEDAARESGVKDVADDLNKIASPRSMGLDAVKSAADKFEKWDPLKSTRTPPVASAAVGAGLGSAAAAEAKPAEAAITETAIAETANTETGPADVTLAPTSLPVDLAVPAPAPVLAEAAPAPVIKRGGRVKGEASPPKRSTRAKPVATAEGTVAAKAPAKAKPKAADKAKAGDKAAEKTKAPVKAHVKTPVKAAAKAPAKSVSKDQAKSTAKASATRKASAPAASADPAAAAKPKTTRKTAAKASTPADAPKDEA